MTNTVYFHNTIRDDVSTTTEETSSTSSPYTPQRVYFHNTIPDNVSVVFTTTTEDEETPPTANRYTHQQQALSPEDAKDAAPNAVYFHNTIREDVSTTTEDEETPPKSDSYTHQQGLKPVDDNNDAKYVAPTPPSEGGKLEYSKCKEFSFNELKTATRNFHHGVLLDGPCGRVFKGWMYENKLRKRIPVAIKRLEHRGLSFQDHSEWQVNSWQAEVNYLVRLYHPNLVKLLGYCSHNKERLLVYEFMPRGSLKNHLFKKVSSSLSWIVRMKIALGATKGLAFLHSAPINVIHQEFISSNILLDKDYNAKLSCFKVAGDGLTGNKSHISTRVVGYGYAAPEYLATGCLTAKSNVYTFGVVLLEMLTGRQVIDMDRPSEERFLVKWAKPYLNHKYKVYCVADSRLGGQYSLVGFQKAANLALICLSLEGMSRPNMDEVVKVLGEL